ncbi:hypothetical protein [Rhodopila sp.]|uniref:hypothetical protein n=1 Tax=Rhodopila sp. TaxID=2480087 RepID=UPI003D0F750B
MPNLKNEQTKHLARWTIRGRSGDLANQLEELGKQCAALADYDLRSPDEIVGYDETGMWT